MAQDNKLRQAVIIIHGIGEQRPMETLRGFVNSMLQDADDPEREQFYSEPDKQANTYELRRMQSAHLDIKTDFYEFYWAHHMSGEFHHVLNWVQQLLNREPDRRLKPFWLAGRGLAWIIAIILVWWIISLLMGIVFPTGLWVSFTVVLLLGYSLITTQIADAARYLHPSARNVAVRQRIRADGVALVRRLHESGDYDRIVIVGHSLGAVIAYDIVRYAWLEYFDSYGYFDEPSHDALRKLEAFQLDADATPEQLAQFQDLQRQVWLEQRQSGNRWLVTDLVTMGNPLTYIDYVSAGGRDVFQQLVNLSEYPTAPPKKWSDATPYAKNIPYERDGETKIVKQLHYDAVFACTRFTNYYFPTDLIGGPIAHLLGWGIRDVALDDAAGGWRSRFGSHNWYWFKTGDIDAGDRVRWQATMALRASLQLDDETWKSNLHHLRDKHQRKAIQSARSLRAFLAQMFSSSTPPS